MTASLQLFMDASNINKAAMTPHNCMAIKRAHGSKEIVDVLEVLA
jgi:hypothetical protein